MVTITNPETGERHFFDKEAYAELRQAYDQSILMSWDEVVFRAMRIDIAQAREILATDL